MESYETVRLVTFVNFVRTRLCQQVSLVEGEVSHKVHKCHNAACNGKPLSKDGQVQNALENLHRTGRLCLSKLPDINFLK